MAIGNSDVAATEFLGEDNGQRKGGARAEQVNVHGRESIELSHAPSSPSIAQFSPPKHPLQEEFNCILSQRLIISLSHRFRGTTGISTLPHNSVPPTSNILYKNRSTTLLLVQIHNPSIRRCDDLRYNALLTRTTFPPSFPRGDSGPTPSQRPRFLATR